MWKHRLILLLLWIASLVGITLRGGIVSYAFFWGVTFIPVLAWVYILAEFLCFKIYQEIGTRNVVSGEPVPYYFVLQNESWFSFAGIRIRMHDEYSYVKEMTEDEEYELIPEQQYKYETSLVCRYRGEYEVGIGEVIVTDFLGLFYLRYPIREGIRAIVLPKIVDLDSLDCVKEIEAPFIRESLQLRQQPDLVVRDYVPGDPMKQIHWKATAVSGELKVREKSGEEKQGVAVYMDTRRRSKWEEEYLPVENKVLELALALAFYWTRRHVEVKLLQGNDISKPITADTLEEFDGLYHKVAQISFEMRDDNESGNGSSRSLVGRNVHRNNLISARILFLILQELDEEAAVLLEELKQNACEAIVFLVGEKGLDKIPEYGKGIKIIAVDAQADLKEVLS